MLQLIIRLFKQYGTFRSGIYFPIIFHMWVYFIVFPNTGECAILIPTFSTTPGCVVFNLSFQALRKNMVLVPMFSTMLGCVVLKYAFQNVIEMCGSETNVSRHRRMCNFNFCLYNHNGKCIDHNIHLFKHFRMCGTDI